MPLKCPFQVKSKMVMSGQNSTFLKYIFCTRYRSEIANAKKVDNHIKNSANASKTVWDIIRSNNPLISNKLPFNISVTDFNSHWAFFAKHFRFPEKWIIPGLIITLYSKLLILKLVLKLCTRVVRWENCLNVSISNDFIVALLLCIVNITL